MASDDKPSWNVLLLIGAIAGVAFGALLVLLFRERRGQSQLMGPSGNPINIYNVSGGQLGMQHPQALLPGASPESTRQLVNQMGAFDGTSYATKMDTVMLNPVRSVRVFTVPRKGPMWLVRLNVVGPAGGFGMFAIDNPLPEGPSTNLTMGAPQGIIVPAGGSTEIRLGPRQIIYGRAAGTEDDVQVSYSASAEIV
jgi:hypothetical protein